MPRPKKYDPKEKVKRKKRDPKCVTECLRTWKYSLRIHEQQVQYITISLRTLLGKNGVRFRYATHRRPGVNGPSFQIDVIVTELQSGKSRAWTFNQSSTSDTVLSTIASDLMGGLQ